MTDTSSSPSAVLDDAMKQAPLTLAKIAKGAGIKTAQLKRYRGGEEAVPGEVLREALPAALRGHAQLLMKLAAQLEAVPEQRGPRPTIRTQLISELMQQLEKGDEDKSSSTPDDGEREDD